MDTEIDELREEVKRLRVLTEDTNKMVHKMHRSAVWGRIFSWVWWGVVLLLTGSVYYYFLMPYLTGVMELYGSIESGAEQGQTLFSQVQELLQQYRRN